MLTAPNADAATRSCYKDIWVSIKEPEIRRSKKLQPPKISFLPMIKLDSLFPSHLHKSPKIYMYTDVYSMFTCMNVYVYISLVFLLFH